MAQTTTTTAPAHPTTIATSRMINLETRGAKTVRELRMMTFSSPAAMTRDPEADHLLALFDPRDDTLFLSLTLVSHSHAIKAAMIQTEALRASGHIGGANMVPGGTVSLKIVGLRPLTSLRPTATTTNATTMTMTMIYRITLEVSSCLFSMNGEWGTERRDLDYVRVKLWDLTDELLRSLRPSSSP